jgi:hypothetical protein
LGRIAARAFDPVVVADEVDELSAIRIFERAMPV